MDGTRFFCHACSRSFHTRQRCENCPLCTSSFLEEIDDTPENMRYQLSDDQARRLTNAAALLQLLESQLREELDILQSTLASAENKPPPLTKGMTDRLQKTKVTVEMLCDQPRCPICSEDYVVPEDVLRIPCSHYFHSSCVMPWLEAKRTCPMCRYELRNEVPPREELRKLTLDELKERIHHHENHTTDGCEDGGTPSSGTVEQGTAAEKGSFVEGAGGDASIRRVNSVDECFDREILVERYYDLLVEEKEGHDHMEARARGEGTDVGGLYGNPFSSHVARNQQLAEAMRARASAQANGAARLAASPFSPHPHRPQQYPMGALMGRMAGQEDEGVGRGVWLQQSGGPGMRVLRVAPGPGSFRALSMPVGAAADGDDDSDFPPFGHPPMGITMSMGGRGSSGMRLMSTRIPNDSDSDGGDGSSDGEGDGRNHGASGSLPSYRVINNPQHRGLGGALAQSHSLPARMIISGRNVESSVSTATVPTRTTYILRTVHGGGAPEGQGSRGYEAHPMRWSSGGGDNTEDRN